MTKEDCLKDLPPKTRVVKKVVVSSRFQIMYTNAMNALAKLYDSCQELDDDKHKAVLGGLQRVRYASALAKVDATVSLAISILEKEPAIVLFTSFIAVAKELHKKLGESGWE